jgi:hypothetical protein
MKSRANIRDSVSEVLPAADRLALCGPARYINREFPHIAPARRADRAPARICPISRGFS